MYWCQYQIRINDTHTRVNYTAIQPINATGNSTHICYYCNLTMQLKNCSSSRPFYGTIEDAPWLKYSSIPQAILDIMGLAGIAYGVVVFGHVSYSTQGVQALVVAGLAAAAYSVMRINRRRKEK
jgi:hypothetical protein